MLLQSSYMPGNIGQHARRKFLSPTERCRRADLHLNLRSLVVKHRGKFILSLIGASTTEDTTAASQTMIQDFNTWILDLQTHAMTAPLGNRRVRKSTVMMVKQRAKNFTYSTTLIKFGVDPTTTTLQALRASFKELWVLKNIFNFYNTIQI